jgi:hypothetical protein
MILSKMITIARATGTFFEFGPRSVFLLGFPGNPGFGSTPVHSGYSCLFVYGEWVANKPSSDMPIFQ